eukprot:PRCOL_00005905-RA
MGRKNAAAERRRALREAADRALRDRDAARDVEYARLERERRADDVLGAGQPTETESGAERVQAEVEAEEEKEEDFVEEPGVTYLELEDLDMDIIDEDAEEDGLPPPPESSKADLGDVEAKRLQMLKEAAERLEAEASSASAALEDDTSAIGAAQAEQRPRVDAQAQQPKEETMETQEPPAPPSPTGPAGDAQAYTAPNPAPIGEPSDADLEAASQVIERMLNAGGLLDTVIDEYSHAGAISQLLVEVCTARAELERELGRTEQAEACALLRRRLVAERKKRAAPPELRLLDELIKSQSEEELRKRMDEAFGRAKVDVMDAAWELAETKVAPSALTVDKVPPNAIVGTVDQILLADAFSSASVAGLSAKEMLEEAKKRKMLEQKLQLIRAIAKGYC